MQIIELELSHFNLYSPVNGEQISSEEDGINEEALSLMGYWQDEIMGDPFIKDPDLQLKWEEMVTQKKEELLDYLDYYEALEKFLRKYPGESWIVFKIITGAAAGSPRNETAWFVIDMEAT
jgi:hypothetical protein